jgi:hypothetical protein
MSDDELLDSYLLGYWEYLNENQKRRLKDLGVWKE